MLPTNFPGGVAPRRRKSFVVRTAKSASKGPIYLSQWHQEVHAVHVFLDGIVAKFTRGGSARCLE